MTLPNPKVLVSACLLGPPLLRYDGHSRKCLVNRLEAEV